MRVTLVGHSTVLVECAGSRVLIDPYFGGGNLAYRRLGPPAFRRADVGPVDGVLISHTHFDHFDRAYLRSLPAAVPVHVAALGRFWGTLKAGRSLRPLAVGETVRLGELEVTGVPAHHLGPTVGFVLRGGEQTLYFAGDTFYGRFMAAIAREHAPQVCLMPVYTYRTPMTMGNTGALKALETLRPEVVVPIHGGIAPRSPLLRRRESAESFRRRVEAANLPTAVRILAPGQAFTW